MARPRLDEEERRAQTVGVRVTAAEAAELRERAEAARLSMGAYLRRRALGQRVRKPSAVSKSTSLSGGLRSAAVVSSEKKASQRATAASKASAAARTPAKNLKKSSLRDRRRAAGGHRGVCAKHGGFRLWRQAARWSSQRLAGKLRLEIW